jgi:hypothetical protein
VNLPRSPPDEPEDFSLAPRALDHRRRSGLEPRVRRRRLRRRRRGCRPGDHRRPGRDRSEGTGALQAAGLVETLQGPGPFTVFAPTDDAFAALPEGALDALLLPENKDALVKILTFHVVAGQVMAADVTAGDVPTVEGSNLTITTDGGVKIFDANVTQADVLATNGVIHVIDQVLIPESVDVAALLG